MFQNYWRFLTSVVWLSATGVGQLELLQFDRIGCQHFYRLLGTSMPRKQRKITGEVSRSSDSKSHFIITVLSSPHTFCKSRYQLEEADTRKHLHGLHLEMKNQFLHLTSCFNSVSEINRRHFCTARCTTSAAPRFANRSGFPGARDAPRSFTETLPAHPFVPPLPFKSSRGATARQTGSVNKDDGPFSHYQGAWGRPRQRN